MPEMRLHASLLEVRQGHVPVQGMRASAEPSLWHGDAGIETPVPLLVHSDAPADRNEAHFLRCRTAKAAGAQEVSAYMGNGSQTPLRHGTEGQRVYADLFRGT